MTNSDAQGMLELADKIEAWPNVHLQPEENRIVAAILRATASAPVQPDAQGMLELADGTPEKILRGWAMAYRETPEHRFPSDPHAEFFPLDLERAADELEALRNMAINAAASAPVQGAGEPVAWRTLNDFGYWHVTTDAKLAATWIAIEKFAVESLYAHPSSDRPESAITTEQLDKLQFGRVLHDRPASAQEGVREALASARGEIAITIAFLGRDAGTDRIEGTITGLIERLAKADAAARKALAALPASGTDGFDVCEDFMAEALKPDPSEAIPASDLVELPRLRAVAWAAQGLLNADTYVSDVPGDQAVREATIKLQQALGTWQMHHTAASTEQGGGK